MYWVSFKRVIRSGLYNFWRNGFVSLSSVLIMLVTLFVIGSVIFLSALLNASLDELKNKVDVNVYFTTNAAEEDILAMKKSIEALPEVEHTTYQSKEEALIAFKERHKDDRYTLQALEELEGNPLGAVLNIKAKDPSQYEGIAKYLESQNALSPDKPDIIDKVNYFQNKEAIDRLSKIIDSADKLGFAITIVLVVVSILITFNTIRLAIFISKEEISVMKLVGASSWYVRGPFITTGILYGAISGLVTLIIFVPLTYWLGDVSENFFIGLNLFDYYISNFGQIFLVIVVSGMLIGALSSFLAVRKYLEV